MQIHRDFWLRAASVGHRLRVVTFLMLKVKMFPKRLTRTAVYDIKIGAICALT